jgi:hypothetical protein
MTDKNSSSRIVTGLAGSVQKRKTLILHENDPRALDPFYVANYVGEVRVLSDSEYLKYLKKNNVIQNDPVDEGVLVPNLHPPTNLYWDTASPTDTTYDQSNASSLVSIIVTFDPATDDLSTDGTIQYEVVADISNHQVSTAIDSVGGADSTNAASTKTIKSDAVKKPVVLSTVSSPIHLGSHISLKWKGYKDADGYEVGVTGINLDVIGNKKYFLYNKISSNLDANGYHTLNLYPKSGKLFSGHYSFTIAVRYGNSTTKAVTYSGFTI